MKTEQNLTEFNARVERLRTTTGRTWAEIAGALDVSRTMLHYYRSGQHPPDSAVLYRLAQAEHEASAPSAPSANPAPGGSSRTALAGPAAANPRQNLRWLRDLLQQQLDVIAAAERYARDLQALIAQAESELPVHERVAKADRPRHIDRLLPADEPARPARRKEKRAWIKRPVVEQTYLRDIATVSLPIFGSLPAGFPQTCEGVAAQRPARRVEVPKNRFPDCAFGLDVRGDSMNAATPEAIFDGDTVVLLPPEQRPPRVGDIVAALIDGETCLKRLVRGGKRGARGHHLRSESLNPAHGELFPAHDLVIQGVLVGKL